ncbi:hydroxypyruvate isomerase [Citrobacter sp. NCU1]|uniref:hydroxypyruvate isomerase n=1 Tax=Citrobacter sp. NCU1 TaxID=2026683 RepID=UPI001390EAA1|nr:hydroxypyruvate isomerase [Citrobacter sp. NCU1]NDO79641.1 hydroxypyruvate isomerase [Citrobacter sp. NCU1]
MPKFAANLSMLFTEAPFMERFALAKEAGFSGVEYLFPYDVEPQEIAALLEKHHLKQVLFNLPAGDWQAGERGIACHPDRIEEFRNGVELAVTYAKALNCTQVNCLAGKLPERFSANQCHETLLNNLRYAAEKLAASGITLVLEAINTRDISGFFVNNTRQVLNILREVGHDNLRYQYDIYHMQIMEGDLARTIEQHINVIGHIQLADNPGRHEPGTGEINYPWLLQKIDELGYQGWIGCEYIPLGNTQAGLGWMKTLTVK